MSHVKIKVRKAARFPGVAAAAKTLGCTRAHVWLVWAGERQSKRVLALKPYPDKNDDPEFQ